MLATTLQRYFPQRLREQFAQQVLRHPLRREIIATHVVNSMVNRVGPTFVHRLHEETGAAPPDIVRAYMVTRQAFDLISLWLANEALDRQISVQTQNEIVLASLRQIERGTVWLLHQREALRDVDATIRRFAPGVAEVGAGLERWLAAHERSALDAEAARLAAQGVPHPLAQRVARLEAQVSALDIVEVGTEVGAPVETVAGVYFGVGGRLDLGWLSQQIGRLPAGSHWQGLARVAMRDDLTSLARALAHSVLRDATTPAAAPAAQIAAWEAQRVFQLARCRQLLTDLKPAPALDLAMLSVLLRELRALV